MILNACCLKVKLGGASFSLGPLAEPSNSTDPSQPCVSKMAHNYLVSLYIIVRYNLTLNRLGAMLQLH